MNTDTSWRKVKPVVHLPVKGGTKAMRLKYATERLPSGGTLFRLKWDFRDQDDVTVWVVNSIDEYGRPIYA
ncbi:MAG: hypothetical protein ACRD4Q_04980 [Candidatus Acidiferrales bacterium]